MATINGEVIATTALIEDAITTGILADISDCIVASIGALGAGGIVVATTALTEDVITIGTADAITIITTAMITSP